MSPSAIYSKSGKGVQEASGKTSHLSRADRAVLSAIDGKMTLEEVADKVGKPFDAKFEELIGKLDKEGFVRQVSAGAPVAPAPKPAAAAPAKPAGAAPAKAPGEDLDFTVIMPAPKIPAAKPAAPPPAPPVAPHMAQSQAAAFAKAREEAEEKAARERDRIKAETEAKLRAETEAKMRSEAEAKAKSDAEAKLRAEAEAKVKAAREAAVRAAAEAKAKAEAEAAAKLEAERARVREAEEKARREAEEAKRQAEEAKRRAEEEARKAREEAERIRREAEEAKRQAEEARRKAEEEARRIREEAERKAKEEAERRRKEEEARRAREEQERKEREARAREEEARKQKEREEREAREEKEREERKARERAEREQREREEEAREAAEKAERKAREKAEREAREQEEMEREAREIREKAARKEQEKAAAKPASFGDSLLADLDSFSQRDEDERKEKEEAARKEKEAARRKQEEAERQAKEKAEREEQDKRRAEDERRRKEEEARRREEEERREREAKEKEEEEERRRKRRAKDEAKPAADDIPVSDDDLDMDEVKKDEAILSKESRRAAREREERERQAKKDAKREAKRAAKEEKDEKRARRDEPAPPPQFRRPRKWGKTVATLLFVALVAGVGVIHVMPISTAEYETAASQAVGRPVKIGSGRISLYSGVQLKFDNVTVGDAKIGAVRAHPEIGSLFGDKKAFSRIELERVTVPMAAIGELFGAKVRGDSFTVGRVSAKQVALAGPLKLPPLEVDLALAPDGAVSSTSLRGPEGLSGKLTPKSASEMDFDVVAHSFTVPIVPDMSLSGFAMKGTATRDGMRIESWGGSSLDGGVSGTANVRWSSGNWNIEGVMTVRGINAAVFAPALLSEGKAEGTGRFSFSDADPMSFLSKGRIEGTYSVHKGVLGSFDLSRAITTGGRQVGGRTPFTALSGQGVFDKGAVALRNVSFGAGALNAGASADISPEGNLSGRIVADVRTPSQTLRATLNLGGTVKDPQVKN